MFGDLSINGGRNVKLCEVDHINIFYTKIKKQNSPLTVHKLLYKTKKICQLSSVIQKL